MTSSNSDSSWLPRANLQILCHYNSLVLLKRLFLQTCSLGLLRVINPYVDFKFNFFGLVGSISNGESPIGIIIPFGTDDWHMDTPRCDYMAVGAMGPVGLRGRHPPTPPLSDF